MNSLRLELDTSSNSDLFATQSTLVPSLQNEWETFEDEGSLKKVLESFVAIIKSEGLNWLDFMGIPDLQPESSWLQQLANEPSLKADRFAEEHSLSYSDIHDLKRLEVVIVEQKNTRETIDEAFIIYASAYFGEYIRRNLGGTWGWEEFHQQPGILNISGKDSLAVCPMRDICRFWSKPSLETRRLSDIFEFNHKLSRS